MPLKPTPTDREAGELLLHFPSFIGVTGFLWLVSAFLWSAL